MFLSILSAVFFFSGFSSLIYQIAWQRLLTVYYGVGMLSVTIMVSLYMLGLGVGALAGGHLAESLKDRVKAYFWVELSIGLFGLISLPFLDLLGKWTAGSNYALTFIWQALFLFVPTFLMGITLPLLTKIFNQITRQFVQTVSFLYFINTLGAAIGSLFATYVVISIWGIDSALYFASGINFLLAITILVCRKFLSSPKHPEADMPDEILSPGFGRIIFLLVFLTGFLAIGYEMIWYRLIVVLVKASPYAFSSILFVYLLGISLGSLASGRYLYQRPGTDRRKMFFLLQFILGTSVAVIILAYYYLTKFTSFGELTALSFSCPTHPPVDLFLSKTHLLTLKDFLRLAFVTVDVFFWPLFFCFIPAMIMGATFPVISDLAYFHRNKEGLAIARVYFFNILGNVAGGMATSFMLLPFLSTERTLFIFVLAGLICGSFIVALRRSIGFLACSFVLGSLVIVAFPKAGQLYAIMHTSPGKNYVSYFQEGVSSVVMTYTKGNTVQNYIDGHSHGGRPGYSFYVFVIEALNHVPEAKNALVIGYGTGSITEALLKNPLIKKITLIELRPTLLKNLNKSLFFNQMLSDPRLEIIVDDGRRFLLRNHGRYDMIFMTVLRTTTSKSNNIYSRQFFELVRGHLADSGLLLVWMDEFSGMLSTLGAVFDHLKFFMGPYHEGFCLVSQKPLTTQPRLAGDMLIRTFNNTDQYLIKQMRQHYVALTDSQISDLRASGLINEDWKPYNEYFIGKFLRMLRRESK
jgi:predicted membrane-bound spermidine synthase